MRLMKGNSIVQNWIKDGSKSLIKLLLTIICTVVPSLKI